MTSRGGYAALVLVVVAAVAAGAQAPPITFRATTGVVLVPVWVKDKGKPVPGLSASDFELTDNGVLQELGSLRMASQPVDVTILLDTSESLDNDSLARLRSGIETICRSLPPSDRIRLLTFATQVTEVFGFQSGGVVPRFERVGSGGTTALYDALAATLLSTPRSDRPQLVFAVTDGGDNASVLKAPNVVALAGLSDASLYATVVRTAPRAVPWGVLYVLEQLREASARSGGTVFENPPETSLPALFRQVLSDFRTSYLLSFTPSGVGQGGWHDLVVRTKERRYTVRARAGYQG